MTDTQPGTAIRHTADQQKKLHNKSDTASTDVLSAERGCGCKNAPAAVARTKTGWARTKHVCPEQRMCDATYA